MHDTKSVIGVAIATDPGGKKYIFGIEMFGGALCGIIFVIGVVIATDPGGTEYFFDIAIFVSASCAIKYYSTFPFLPSCILAWLNYSFCSSDW